MLCVEKQISSLLSAFMFQCWQYIYEVLILALSNQSSHSPSSAGVRHLTLKNRNRLVYRDSKITGTALNDLTHPYKVWTLKTARSFVNTYNLSRCGSSRLKYSFVTADVGLLKIPMWYFFFLYFLLSGYCWLYNKLPLRVNQNTLTLESRWWQHLKFKGFREWRRREKELYSGLEIGDN